MGGLKYANAERLSHAYIISAATQEQALSQATELAAAAVCTGQGEKPCGVCRNCRKARQGVHPDITTVIHLLDDKGREKREIVVTQIRELIADACVRPNEAEKKVYIIRDADTMNASAQNAALKLLEEPPAGVHFLLCVTNPQLLLPTVRSRCVEINISGENEQTSEPMKLAGEFIRQVASGDRAKLLAWCNANDAMDTRFAAEFVGCAFQKSADMLCGRESMEGMARQELAMLNELLGRCGDYLKVNVGPKHILGLLAVRAIAKERKQN